MLHARRLSSWGRVALAGAAAAGLSLAALSARQPQTSYSVVTAENRRPLAVRTIRSAEMVALDAVGALFGFRSTEDSQVGGLTVEVRGRRILLIADQSFAQVDGQVRTLSAPVIRERGRWEVPLDFLSDALAPVLETRIEVRRASRLIIVGDLRIPRVTGRVELEGDGARVALDLTPGAPARATREGDLLRIRIDAHALDLGPITGTAPRFVTGLRVEGTTITFGLGASVDTIRPESAAGRIAVSLLPPGAPPAPPPQPVPAPPPLPDFTGPGVVRTVVIDPGHGGEDAGMVGAAGTKEKDVTLRVARRLKTAIENRVGLRVVLTRDADEAVTPDERSATANHNKADLFISLHANGAPDAQARGAQVLSVDADDYSARRPRGGFGGQNVPAVGGRLRLVEAVPWDLAQLPYTDRSAALAAVLVAELTAKGVPLFARPADQVPLRLLVGANMPAIQVEMGFLSNAGDEAALAGQDRTGAIVEAIIGAIATVRNGIVVGRGRPAR